MFFQDSRGKAKLRVPLDSDIRIGLIPLTYILMLFFFSISKSVTLLVLSLAPVDTEGPFIPRRRLHVNEEYSLCPTGRQDYSREMKQEIPILFATYMIFEGILLLLKLRFYMVAVLAMVLPFTITLYAFIPTRNIGKLWRSRHTLDAHTGSNGNSSHRIAIGISLTDSITSFTVTEYLSS